MCLCIKQKSIGVWTTENEQEIELLIIETFAPFFRKILLCYSVRVNKIV